jgi:uncharacterized protein CbrC (UPF0167 family)
MSGGAIGDYGWFRINETVEEIEHLLSEIGEYDFSAETIYEIIKTRDVLKEAAIRHNRLDYLIADDDSEDSYHKRLREELVKAGIEINE